MSKRFDRDGRTEYRQKSTKSFQCADIRSTRSAKARQKQPTRTNERAAYETPATGPQCPLWLGDKCCLHSLRVRQRHSALEDLSCAAARQIKSIRRHPMTRPVCAGSSVRETLLTRVLITWSCDSKQHCGETRVRGAHTEIPSPRTELSAGRRREGRGLPVMLAGDAPAIGTHADGTGGERHATGNRAKRPAETNSARGRSAWRRPMPPAGQGPTKSHLVGPRPTAAPRSLRATPPTATTTVAPSARHATAAKTAQH